MKTSKKVLAIFGAVIAGGASVVAPLASYADVNNTATITVNVNETLSMKINDSTEAVTTTVNMANNELNETSQHKITVATNNPKGYTLTLIDQDTDNSLKRDASSNIPAVSGGTLVATTPGWGFKVKAPGSDSFESNYHAVPKSSETAYTVHMNDGTGITTSSFSEDTYVQIGIATGSVPSGAYSDVIVYNASGNV